MNIQVVAEHSVDMDLINAWGDPALPTIVDAGCRGMHFTNYFRNLGMRVWALDCDDLKHNDYMQVALGGSNRKVGIKRSSDPQATTICDGDEVECITLESLRSKTGIGFFDLIKLDIEGSEYDVIMNMDRAFARQLSIEFHLHTKVYDYREMIEMESVLLDLGYFPVKHDKTSQHGMGFNYWDSLWILK